MPGIDFVCRREFDYTVVEYANGKPLSEILGFRIATRMESVHNADRPDVMDPGFPSDVTDVYYRDMDVRRYNVPFLLYPFVALYTTAAVGACTSAFWPQTLSGHPCGSVRRCCGREMAKAKEYWPFVKEYFFDRRYFQHPEGAHRGTLRPAEAAEHDGSCTSRVTTDYETLKAKKKPVAGC